MRIELIGKPETIISNPLSHHGYFAWPTVALLQDGKIAVGASGFRLEHVCPFGKAVISYSYDGGKTYTLPAPVIDTPLDDRDAGICTFGKSGVIFTSFNNSADMQREYNKDNAYVQSYINTITEDDEIKYLGSNFRISNDCGISFGKLYHSPISSPHGPVELKNGTVLWAGTDFNDYKNGVEIHSINTENGSMNFIGKIYSKDKNVILNEPDLLELPDGRLLCHIRGENDDVFTVFQSYSDDQGKTWSEPEMLLDETGGAPPHLLMLKSGVIISAYGRRKKPYGIMVMVSVDNGLTWEKDIRLYENNVDDDDIGYPSTIELDDGTLLTVFYALDKLNGPCVIKQQKWKIKL